MTEFEGCFLTEAGLRICKKEGLANIVFTRAVTGAGIYQSEDDIAEMARLKDERQEFAISCHEITAEHDVDVVFWASNEGLKTGYDMTEIGLYAEDENGDEVLYCVAFAYQDKAEHVPAETDSFNYYTRLQLTTAINDHANVVVKNEALELEDVRRVVKEVTGEVNVSQDGTLQEQIDRLHDDTLANRNSIDKLLARLTQLEDLVRRLFAFSYDADSETVCTSDGGVAFEDETITLPVELSEYIEQDEEIRLSGGSPGGGGIYVLPPATATRLGGVKEGNGVSIAADGTISVDAETILMDYDVMATDEEVEEAIGE